MAEVLFKRFDKLKKNALPLSEDMGKGGYMPFYYCEVCGCITEDTYSAKGKELCKKCEEDNNNAGD